MANDPTVRAPSDPPSAAAPERIGRYVVKREIARGGMGVVCEAEDPELRRRVALKLVREGDVDAELIARLHREATIAAGLQHPNIVGIHEVGMARDPAGRAIHFIAMDLVEGRTLDDVLHRDAPKREELLRMVEETARAVGYAHSRGVIHRDLKPANVLVDKDGRVLLTDFGLARAEQIHTQLTQSQSVMGTPRYMAPEQVEGRHRDIDARTDVYALGVLFYEALTRKAPFDHEVPAHLYDQILHDDPVRPSVIEPSVERDLDVICLKAMDKDREVRYANATEFAEDLARFRRGEPILAQPPSVMYRVRKWTARRRTALALTGLALMILALVSTVLLSRVRTERARTLDQLRKRTRQSLDAALELRRAGRTEGFATFAKETETACTEAIASFPDAAEPHHLLGRMYRALMRDDEALAAQDRALRLDPRMAAALYERVVLTSRLYRRRTDELVQRHFGDDGRVFLRQARGRRRWMPSLVELCRLDAEAQRLRARLDADLAALTMADALAPAEAACAKGLRAWVRGETDAAHAHLVAAIGHAVTLEEAYETLAMLELDRGRHEEAVRWCTNGLDHDRGYLPHYEGRGFARLLLALETAQRRGDPLTLLKEALDDYTRVVEQSPSRAEPRAWRAVVYMVRDAHIIVTTPPKDLSPLFAEAKSDLEVVVRLVPDDPRGWQLRGLLHVGISWYTYARGDDPGLSVKAAQEDFQRSLKIDASRDGVWYLRGAAHGVQALYLLARGEDPAPDNRKAIESLSKCIELNPNRVEAWMWRGVSNGGLALKELQEGRDPRPQYEKAMKDLGHAIAIDDEAADAYAWRGMAQTQWMLYVVMSGQDPTPTHAAAVRDLDRAIELNPWGALAYRFRGDAFMNLGDYRALKKEDAAAAYRAALSSYEDATRLSMVQDEKIRGNVVRARKYVESRPPK